MKTTIISIITAIVFLGGVFMLTGGNDSPKQETTNKIPGFTDSDQLININNVSIVEGKQIIKIRAKGGYQPRTSVAKAGLPTILRFDTGGTFDCSSSIRIPVLGISKILPQTGTTDIDLGLAKAGVLQGTCGMGMYPFEINFQS